MKLINHPNMKQFVKEIRDSIITILQKRLQPVQVNLNPKCYNALRIYTAIRKKSFSSESIPLLLHSKPLYIAGIRCIPFPLHNKAFYITSKTTYAFERKEIENETFAL